MIEIWNLQFEADAELEAYGDREDAEVGLALFLASRLREQGLAAIDEFDDHVVLARAEFTLRVDAVAVHCSLMRDGDRWNLHTFPLATAGLARGKNYGCAEHQQLREALDQVTLLDTRFRNLQWSPGGIFGLG